MADTYVLDSFALLALMGGERGGATVRALIEAAIDGRYILLLSEINLGEVVYIIERRRGLPAAQETLAQIEALPIRMVEATRERVLAAAHLKAHHPIAYADAFAATLAQEFNATLITGDPEFRILGKTVAIEWLD